MTDPSSRLPLLAGALLAALGVALGAFGAHALRGALDATAQGWWQTAVQYQMWHALGLLAIGAARVPGSRLAALLSVITGFDVVMVTLRDGELPHERRSALLLEREGALHSGVFKAMPFGCGLRPQP